MSYLTHWNGCLIGCPIQSKGVILDAHLVPLVPHAKMSSESGPGKPGQTDWAFGCHLNAICRLKGHRLHSQSLCPPPCPPEVLGDGEANPLLCQGLCVTSRDT